MGTTTFSGPVRSQAGFDEITVGSTGLVTTTSAVTTVNTMTAGSGITSATGELYASTITKTVTPIVTYFYTRIFIDLTGLDDGGTTLDIIGDDGGAANCHFGQITTAANGLVYTGQMTCLEAPATGGADIDLYSATLATGAQDALVTALDEVLLINGGTQALAGTVATTTGVPRANDYLYLAGVTASDATYSAGRLLVELWGSSLT